MEIHGTQRVRASRQAVWVALNDPAVLARCIPGCTSLVETEPDHFTAEVTLKVGPISAVFRGSVSLEDKQEPESCKIVGSGSGGAAGFAKGSAFVTLAEDGEATNVVYDIDIETGGKMASLGARMMKRVIDSNIESFFEGLARELEGGAPVAAARTGRVEGPVAAASAPLTLQILDRVAWFGAGIGATLAAIVISRGF
ncbi:hypothetical protein SAMN06273572_106103 [Monaibacterium marinum]|uniref:Carbon monoxide dehydrogenase subunit G n=1 Tax=Pontivivens marinum TaxID=1690039 RepID=A0A2C9CUK2_9RHOB|nr:carbon monoxide dehydrogenase subunit G [Monaibacterium marinum]SOH94952.1 hypothetical protein SAMN06273572_106103 [Monaibacterium marinum]